MSYIFLRLPAPLAVIQMRPACRGADRAHKEDRMKQGSLGVGLVFVSVALSAVVGCGGAGTEQEPTGVEGSSIVYSERFSKTGVLEVLKNEAGTLNVSIRGGIGEDDFALAKQAFGQPTLVDTYRVLRPDVQALPARVVELSALLEAQDANQLAPSLSDPPIIEPEPQNKDLARFQSWSCVDIEKPTGWWINGMCYYRTNVSRVISPATFSGKIGSVAWNETDGSAYHQIGSTGQDTYTMGPRTWGLHSWYFPTPVGIMLASLVTGNLGITWHWWQPKPR